MHLINRNTDYAVRAVCFLAKHSDQIVSASELVKDLKVPRPFLRRILQILNKEGLLVSSKGWKGGFKLGQRPKDIYLIDLMRIFQGDIRLNECLLRKKICPNRNTCALKKKMDVLEKEVILKLKSISIKSLL